MAHTLLEAAKLSRNPLTAGVLKGIATTDELLGAIQMQGMQGMAHIYNREKSVPDLQFVSPDHTSVPNQEATFTQVIAPMRLIVSDVDVYMFAQEQMSETNNQRGVQLEKKIKGLGRTLGNKLVSGAYATSVTVSAAIAGVASYVAGPYQDSVRFGPGSLRYDQSEDTLEYRAPGDIGYGTPVDVSSNGTYTLRSRNSAMYLTVTVTSANLPGADAEILVRIASTTEEFDGLMRLTPADQTVASTGTNGDALSFGVLDQLIDEKVKVRENLAFVMNGRLKTKFYELLRGLGAASPQYVETAMGRRPAYRDIPILQSDHIPSNEAKGSASNLSSVFLTSLDPIEGLAVRVGAQGEAVEADLDPRNTRVMGVKLREVGELEDKEATRDRLSWYGTTHLGSDLAIARASEIITA